MNTEVYSRTFTCFDDFVPQLFFHFGHNLFNTRRMDTSIADKLMESQTASFTTDRIKRRNNDSLWSIIYNDFNATGSFKCTDITTFTSDDTSFHFVVIDMEYRNSILYGSFCCHSLNGLYHNFLSLSIGIQLGLIHNFVYIASSISL